MRTLNPQQIIWGYHLVSVCATFLTSGGQYSSPEEKSTRVPRSNRILLNVNEPKAKITTVPLCISGHVATCLLHFVDRSFAYVVHSWLIIDLPDRRSPSISNHILYLITLYILDPGILTIEPSILIFDLCIAQLNRKSILLNVQTSFLINQPIDYFEFHQIASPH